MDKVYNVIRLCPPTSYAVSKMMETYNAARATGDEAKAFGDFRREFIRGFTVEVTTFNNQDSAESYEKLQGDWYPDDPIWTEATELLDTFTQYACGNCGSTSFVMSWSESKHVRLSYDPRDDELDVGEAMYDDYQDSSIACAKCGSVNIIYKGLDLEERVWNVLKYKY